MQDGLRSIIGDVITIQRFIASLFSSRNNRGKLYIDPAQFQMTIGKPVQSDDPFDAFFNGGSNVIEIKKNISTPKIAINVNPLPTGKPADFSVEWESSIYLLLSTVRN